METLEKGDKADASLPTLTPKNPDGPQRVIKQIMVIDPNKIRMAGLDVKMAEALKKTKKTKQPKTKETKLAAAKRILNKKLKEAISKKDSSKDPSASSQTPSQSIEPAKAESKKISASDKSKSKKAKTKIQVVTLNSLMPPPSFPVSSVISPSKTVEIKVLKTDNKKQSFEVKIVDSKAEKVPKIDVFPKASLQAIERPENVAKVKKQLSFLPEIPARSSKKDTSVQIEDTRKKEIPTKVSSKETIVPKTKGVKNLVDPSESTVVEIVTEKPLRIQEKSLHEKSSELTANPDVSSKTETVSSVKKLSSTKIHSISSPKATSSEPLHNPVESSKFTANTNVSLVKEAVPSVEKLSIHPSHSISSPKKPLSEPLSIREGSLHEKSSELTANPNVSLMTEAVPSVKKCSHTSMYSTSPSKTPSSVKSSELTENLNESLMTETVPSVNKYSHSSIHSTSLSKTPSSVPLKVREGSMQENTSEYTANPNESLVNEEEKLSLTPIHSIPSRIAHSSIPHKKSSELKRNVSLLKQEVSSPIHSTPSPEILPIQNVSLSKQEVPPVDKLYSTPIHVTLSPKISSSPIKIFNSTPIRRDSLPHVIESKILSPEEKIDLSILTNRSSNTLTVPKKRYKLDRNWISSESNEAESSCASLSISAEPVEQESAVDFINNLWQLFSESPKDKSTAKKEPEVLANDCSEDATSFLSSLLESKIKTSPSPKVAPIEEHCKISNDNQVKSNLSIQESVPETNLSEPSGQDVNINSENEDVHVVKILNETILTPSQAETTVHFDKSLSEEDKPPTAPVEPKKDPENQSIPATEVNPEISDVSTNSILSESSQKPTPKPSNAPPGSTRRRGPRPIPVLIPKLKKSRKPPAEKLPADNVPQKSIDKPQEESPTQPVINIETSATLDEDKKAELSNKSPHKETQISQQFSDEQPSTSRTDRPQRQRKMSAKLLESSETLSVNKSISQPVVDKPLPQRQRKVSFKLSKSSESHVPDNQVVIENSPKTERPQRQRKITLKLLESSESLPTMKSIVQATNPVETLPSEMKKNDSIVQPVYDAIHSGIPSEKVQPIMKDDSEELTLTRAPRIRKDYLKPRTSSREQMPSSSGVIVQNVPSIIQIATSQETTTLRQPGSEKATEKASDEILVETDVKRRRTRSTTKPTEISEATRSTSDLLNSALEKSHKIEKDDSLSTESNKPVSPKTAINENKNFSGSFEMVRAADETLNQDDTVTEITVSKSKINDEKSGVKSYSARGKSKRATPSENIAQKDQTSTEEVVTNEEKSETEEQKTTSSHIADVSTASYHSRAESRLIESSQNPRESISVDEQEVVPQTAKLDPDDSSKTLEFKSPQRSINIPSSNDKHTVPKFDDFDVEHIESPSFSPICESSRISIDSDVFEELDEDLTSAIIDTVTEAEHSEEKFKTIQKSLLKLSQTRQNVETSEVEIISEKKIPEKPVDSPDKQEEKTNLAQGAASTTITDESSALYSAVFNPSQVNKKEPTKGKTINPFKKQKPTSAKKNKREDSKPRSDFLGFNEKEIQEGQQSTSLRLSQSEDVETIHIDEPSSKKYKIKESQSNPPKKQKTEELKWEKKSANSLKNWLSKPAQSETTGGTIEKDTKEQSSAILPKKRQTKKQLSVPEKNKQQSIVVKDEETNTSDLQIVYVVVDESDDNTSEIKEKPKRGRKSKIIPKDSNDSIQFKFDLNSSKVETKEKPKRGRKSKVAADVVVDADVENSGQNKKSDDINQPVVSQPAVEIEPAVKKKRAYKRKRSISQEKASTSMEQPTKIPHLDNDLFIPCKTTPKRGPGRPKKFTNILESAKGKTDTKYKDDTDFNPKLLLVRDKAELKSTEPLVDPGLQTEPQGPDDVQCALCMGYTSKKKWIPHVSTHYGIGWIVGQQPPLNINSRGAVLSYLLEFFRVSKVKGLTCRICNSLKRSALGLLMHLEICSQTEEESNETRIVCEYCKKNYSKYSFATHKRTCSELLKVLLEKEKAEAPGTSREPKAENFLSNTGRLKRKAVIKAETILKKLDETPEFVPDDLIKYIPIEKTLITEDLMEKWYEQLNDFGNCFCPIKTCVFTATEVNDVVEHYKEGSCPYFEKPGYFCVRCKFHNDDLEEVRSHVVKKHSPRTPKIKANKDDKDAEIYSSESSDSMSSGDDEDSHDDDSSSGEIGEDGVKKPKQVKKSKTKPRYRGYQSKNPPTKDYKRLISRESVPNVRDMVSKFYDGFIRANYSLDPLFVFAKTEFSRIEACEAYIPPSAESIKFMENGFNGYVKTLGSSAVTPDQWRQLKRFEGCSYNREYIFYLGGPVKNIAWVPLDPHPPSNAQYLAVTVRKGLDKFTRCMNQKRSRSLIFIIKFDISSRSEIKGEIMYAIAIDEGPIHAIEFLPSGGYSPEMNRLAMMAVGTIETEIKIYSLPLEVEKLDCDLFPIIRLEPSIQLNLEVMENVNDKTDLYRPQCTCLVWSQFAGHNTIFAGFFNGFVGVWDISDDPENLNKFELNKTKVFTPVSFFWTSEDRLMNLAIHYDMNGPRWLGVSSSTRKLLIYDIRDLTQPMLLKVEVTVNIVNSLQWPTVWENLIFGLGDAMPSSGCMVSVLSPMNIIYSTRRFEKFCTGVSDMHYNIWKNCVAAGTSNGDIQVTGLRNAVLDVSQRLRTDEKTISTLDIVSLEGEAISQSGIQLPSDGLRVFDKDQKDKYGIVFSSARKIKGCKKPDYYNPKRVPPFNLHRLMRVSRIRYNHNKNACDVLAIGYENGLLRVNMSDWLDTVCE